MSATSWHERNTLARANPRPRIRPTCRAGPAGRAAAPFWAARVRAARHRVTPARVRRPQDDRESPSYNVPGRVAAFLSSVDAWAAQMRYGGGSGGGTSGEGRGGGDAGDAGDAGDGGRDVLFMMGTDFTYADANVWYTNMDKLIYHVVSGQRGCSLCCNLSLCVHVCCVQLASQPSQPASWRWHALTATPPGLGARIPDRRLARPLDST